MEPTYGPRVFLGHASVRAHSHNSKNARAGHISRMLKGHAKHSGRHRLLMATIGFDMRPQVRSSVYLDDLVASL